MRLLDSVCKVIADKYPGVPVHVMDVPQGFKRPCFLVTLATEGSDLLNLNTYEDDPIFQIVFFNTRNEADQVYSEGLYEKKEGLKALFLMPGCIPVLPIEGVKEKPRYAKLRSYSSEIRLAENSVYVKVGLSFTETARSLPEAAPVEDLDIEIKLQKDYAKGDV